MTPEGAVRADLRKRAKALGFEHRKLRWIARNGAPDEFLFWPTGDRIHAFVEVKRFGEEPTTQQTREHTRLRDAGFTVAVVDSRQATTILLTELVARASLSVTTKGG